MPAWPYAAPWLQTRAILSVRCQATRQRADWAPMCASAAAWTSAWRFLSDAPLPLLPRRPEARNNVRSRVLTATGACERKLQAEMGTVHRKHQQSQFGSELTQKEVIIRAGINNQSWLSANNNSGSRVRCPPAQRAVLARVIACWQPAVPAGVRHQSGG